jgi:hypothetical protein
MVGARPQRDLSIRATRASARAFGARRVAQLAGRVDDQNPAGQGIDTMSGATVDC